MSHQRVSHCLQGTEVGCCKMSLLYANVVVIKQVIFSGMFGHDDLLQMLIKYRKNLYLTFSENVNSKLVTEFTNDENSFIHLLMMEIS